MEFQGSPLLSYDQSGIDDINSEAKNEKFLEEIKNLFEKIKNDLQKLDPENTGSISQNNLLNYLQSRMPPNRKLAFELFHDLLGDLAQDENSDIEIEEFVKKYIQTQQEMKLNVDSLIKGIEKEKKRKVELLNELKNSKEEVFNNYGFCDKSFVSTKIGKVTLFAQFEGEEIFCTVSLDDSEEKKTKTLIVNNNDLIFKEKFDFNIENKEKSLIYKIYLASNPNESIGEIEVPLMLVNPDNEETAIDNLSFKDNNNQTIGIFKPKLLIVKSLIETYKKQIEYIEKNSEIYGGRIAQYQEYLEQICMPYKKEFDECNVRTQNFADKSENNDEFTNQIEGALKNALGKKSLSWSSIIKLIIYFCILTQLFTTFTKPDFISLVIEIVLAVIINTDMTNYLFEYYSQFFYGIVICICYDLFDFLFVSNIEIKSMSSVISVVRIFGFLGFFGKIALLISLMIFKGKNKKINSLNKQ
jgi:hypothetical protein